MVWAAWEALDILSRPVYARVADYVREIEVVVSERVVELAKSPRIHRLRKGVGHEMLRIDGP